MQEDAQISEPCTNMHPRTVCCIDLLCQGGLPKCIPYTILKVNEVVFVNPHQVSTVEVHISFHSNISKSLLLGLLFI